MPAVTEPPGELMYSQMSLSGSSPSRYSSCAVMRLATSSFDVGAEEDDALLEQPVVDVHPLEGGSLLLRSRREEVALIHESEATGRTARYRPRDAAGVAELADAPGLGPGGAIREGSSPSARTVPVQVRGNADGSMIFAAAMGPPIWSGTAGSGGIGSPAGRGHAIGVDVAVDGVADLDAAAVDREVRERIAARAAVGEVDDRVHGAVAVGRVRRRRGAR